MKKIKRLLTGWLPVSRNKVYKINSEIIKVLQAQTEFAQITRNDTIVLANAVARLHGLKSMDEAFSIQPSKNKIKKKNDVAFG